MAAVLPGRHEVKEVKLGTVFMYFIARLVFSLSLVPNASNCLQPASTKSLCVGVGWGGVRVCVCVCGVCACGGVFMCACVRACVCLSWTK